MNIDCLSLNYNYYKIFEIKNKLPKGGLKVEINIEKNDSMKMKCLRKCIINMKQTYFVFSKSLCFCYDNKENDYFILQTINDLEDYEKYFLAYRGNFFSFFFILSIL